MLSAAEWVCGTPSLAVRASSMASLAPGVAGACDLCASMACD